MTKKEPWDATGTKAGGLHYRAFVGPQANYDRIGAMQFAVMVQLGLRQHHSLLDIGCGSLRGGRFFIPYLLPGNYCGVEPERWLVYDGLRYETGHDVIEIKQPRFHPTPDFDFSVFGQKFDYLMAQSIFSHAPLDMIERCLSSAASVMTNTSVFAATYCPGEEDHPGAEWVYPGLARYTLKTMQYSAQKYGLTCRPRELSLPGFIVPAWLIYTK